MTIKIIIIIINSTDVFLKFHFTEAQFSLSISFANSNTGMANTCASIVQISVKFYIELA